MDAKRLVLTSFLVLSALGLIAGAISVTQPYPIFVNPSQSAVVPFLVSLNTVGGKAYYAVISLSAQSGLTASANVTAYPSSGTSTSNVTIPVGITVSSSTVGVYQLNITVTEYNSTTTPQSVLATYKYITYVHVMPSVSFPTVVAQTTLTSQSQSVSITMPAGASAWYIKYKVLYPNATLAPLLFGASQVASSFLSSTPSVSVTVTPSATTGTTNETVTFNVNVSTNLKFGEVPVTVIVYEYLNGTNALYSVHVLHFRYFIAPNVPGFTLIASQKFQNFTTIGHARFGNISIVSSNIPAKILGIVKGTNEVQLLFNDSFTGVVSFASNVSPSEVIADGKPLTQGYYTVPQNIPTGSWAYINGVVYVNADPSNVTVVYSNTTTTTTTSTSTATSTVSSTISTATSSSLSSSLQSFYEQHKDLVIATVTFVFIVVLLLLFMKK